MKKILIINGVNLNCLGKREASIYGNKTLSDIQNDCITKFGNKYDISFYQSDIEGEICSKINTIGNIDYLIINAGAYTHTSIAIMDAISIFKNNNKHSKVIELHISNIFKREDFRSKSYISLVVDIVFSGAGENAYLSSIAILEHL